MRVSGYLRERERERDREWLNDRRSNYFINNE